MFLESGKDTLLLRQKGFETKNSRYKQILFWLIPLIVFANVLCPSGQRATAVCFMCFKSHKIIQPFLFVYQNLSFQNIKNKNKRG